MGSWISAVLSAAEAVTLEGVLLFLFRVTLIAVCGRLALALLPRASAASRHLIATVTLAVLVALPIAIAVTPAWKLPILPGNEVMRATVPALSMTSAQTFVKGTYDVFDGDEPVARSANPVSPSKPTRAASRPWSIPKLPLPLPLALSLLVVAVCEVMLLRCALSLAAAAWFARCADDVTAPGLRRAFDAARDQLDVTRPINLRETPRVSVPVVAGVFHPTLLLPTEAHRWTRERLDVVFLHELAHVKRLDTLSLVVARTAGALYWFHPLVRSLARDARRECEQACDDRVLASGIRASVYAEHLLTIARSAAGRDPLGSAVLAIARPSNLEQRLSSILSPGVERAPASRRAVVAAVGLGALLLLPLASVRVTAAPARPAKVVAPAPVWRPETVAEAVVEEPVASLAQPTSGAVQALPVSEWSGRRSTPAPSASSQYSAREWYSRAQRNYRRDRFSDAGMQYERAAIGGYNIEVAFYNAACSYSLAREKERALANLHAAVDAGWDDVDMLESDDDLDFIRGDRRFKALVTEVRTADPDAGDRKSARAEFDALQSQRSAEPRDWGSAGISLMHSGDPQKAVDAFENQIKLKPTANAHYNLACAHALAGNKPSAFAALEQAIGSGFSGANHMRDDDDLDALHGEKRFDELVRMTELLELNDEGYGDNEPRGWSKVLPRYERIAKQYPSLGRAWFNLGYAQLRARQFEASRQSFERGLELGYLRATTMYDLGCVSAQLRDPAEAVKWLERAEAEGMDLSFYVASDRDLDPIRSDSRFRELRRRVGDETFDKSRRKLQHKLDKLGRALDNL